MHRYVKQTHRGPRRVRKLQWQVIAGSPTWEDVYENWLLQYVVYDEDLRAVTMRDTVLWPTDPISSRLGEQVDQLAADELTHLEAEVRRLAEPPVLRHQYKSRYDRRKEKWATWAARLGLRPVLRLPPVPRKG